MTEASSSVQLSAHTIGSLDGDLASRIISATSDVAIVLDRDGIVRDVAVSAADLPVNEFGEILERRWIDTVTSESRAKVEELLNEARGERPVRSREINQRAGHNSFPLRYVAVRAGGDGRVLALGRDLRGAEALQNRLLQAQQALERDYTRLRQAETRYRVLFQIASEAVLIVDPASKRILEANPAAGSLIGTDFHALAGRPFDRLFHPESRDTALALVSDLSTNAQTPPVPVRLADRRTGITASASLFRQEGAVHVLVSLAPERSDVAPSVADAKLRLLKVLNRIPDAFAVTDEALNILDVNLAFLELAQVPSAEAARGQPLGRFVGRPGVDLKVLCQNLNDHGWVRSFRTVMRTVFGDQEEVDVSAVAVREGLEATHGFVIRSSRQPLALPTAPARELPRTVEQMMQLVGRVSLREIVAETTDVIERMCIEAALNLTGNNRASAAEILGVSRQSLYSKLNRHGVRGRGPAEPGDER